MKNKSRKVLKVNKKPSKVKKKKKKMFLGLNSSEVRRMYVLLLAIPFRSTGYNTVFHFINFVLFHIIQWI